VESNKLHKTLNITGRSGALPVAAAKLFCGNSGTTIRFLTALCALGRGEFILDGVERMRQRPIGDLSEMLRHLGVRTRCLERSASRRFSFMPTSFPADFSAPAPRNPANSFPPFSWSVHMPAMK